MRIGVDFGTTRVVAAAVDRGNYPVISFDAGDGAMAEYYPPLVAVRGGELVYGWEAHARQGDPEWTVVRSLKRVLEQAGPNTRLEFDAYGFTVLDLLSGLVGDFRRALLESSSLEVAPGEALEVMLGVPANANSNQRFLTAEGFRLAGFHVLGMLNEPSAASLEYGHRNKTESKGRQILLVYDFGGGTFDASLVEHDERTHSVLITEGLSTLGGDDVDQVLAEMALEAAGLTVEQLLAAELFRLLEECRHKKEALHPNTRKIVIDLELVRPGLGEVAVPANDFYERARPLVAETLHTVRDLLEKSSNTEIDCLYMTGGCSELPIVSRMLREEFGRRVKRSAYTRSATAIGLAIQADATSGYQLHEQFTRYFGVWREAESGSRVVFDPLFPKGTPLPTKGEPPLEIVRRYNPVHNIGHFRYLECTQVAGDREPSGDITVWDEILFPFDPRLAGNEDLAHRTVAWSELAPGQLIEECYRCDAGGTVTVSIQNRNAGYQREWPLARWSVQSTKLAPVRKRRTRSREAAQ